jgi:hypothetical protein
MSDEIKYAKRMMAEAECASEPMVDFLWGIVPALIEAIEVLEHRVEELEALPASSPSVGE